MKKFFLFAFLLMYLFTFSQTEYSNFTSTGSGYTTATINDYQSLGINPANLGWTRNENTMNIGFLEFGGMIYSEPLTKKQLVNDVWGSSISLDPNQKTKAVEDFTDTRIYSNNGLLYIGFSYQDEKIGGFAFSIRERFVWHSFLNDNASSFLFLGYTDPYFDSTAYENNLPVGYSTDPQWADKVYQGTDNNLLLYREYNVGYGRKVIKNDNFAWYLGVGVRLITGYGMARYWQDGDNLIGNSAFSPAFGVEYDEPTPSQVEGSGYKKVGAGYGFDIGTSFEIRKNLRIGLAINDIGRIKWDGNVYLGNNGRVWKVETPGIDNYNIFEQGELIVTDNLPEDPEMWEGINDVTIKLPMNFRGGISYRFNPAIEIGGDLYLPLDKKVPGIFEAPVYGVGAKYDPAQWIQLSMSIVSGGKFGTNIPFGVTFYPIKNDDKTWEVGIATRDMITLFKQNNPALSIAFGFLRFSFGHPKE
jgi:hypothetical protein